MNDLTITRLPDDAPEPATDIPPAIPPSGEIGAAMADLSANPPTQLPAPPLTPEQQLQQIGEAHEKAWRAALERWYGKPRAEKILARKLCPFCDHKLRPFRDAKSGAQGQRCTGCGREF